MTTKPDKPQQAEPEEVVISLYAPSKKIYARSVKGIFNTWRWALVWITQIIFYGLPWLVWNNRQAVLFDLDARRFYLFGLVLYPQDFIYLTGLLVIAALSLFLFTAVAGRLWCGYACPQTVYTEIFMWFEKVIEGDRSARMRLDDGDLSGNKFGRKALKHAVWILFAFWTGVTFVGYFTPIKVLVAEFLTHLFQRFTPGHGFGLRKAVRQQSLIVTGKAGIIIRHHDEIGRNNRCTLMQQLEVSMLTIGTGFTKQNSGR